MIDVSNFDLTQLHFLRPLWLWGGLPAVLFCYLLWRQEGQAGRWQRAIDASLLPHLLASSGGGRKRWPLLPLLLAWLLAGLAIAGPVWEKLPQPVRQKEDALVIIQDLSLSLYAQDLSPNRLTRALQKLGDILRARQEGTTALVVYSGDAYVVAPLTDDTRTIDGMVSALSPVIMPSYGSKPGAAVEKALQLLKATAVSHGRLLLISDEVSEADVEAISDLVGRTSHTLSVLGVGTEEGGPIPKEDGGFLLDSQGTIIVPKLSRALLQKLATRNHGCYRDIQLTDEDINYLLAADSLLPREENYRQAEREFDQWRDQGGWLVLLILPLALLSFRRGWLLGLILLLSLWSTESKAMNWQDLWQRSDQQAAAALAQDNPQKAAELFDSPLWKGTAQYRAGDFQGAAQTLANTETADGRYNQGNALAKAGKLAEAKAAYEQALKLDPQMADAEANRKLVEKILAQQQEQDKQDQQDQDGKDGKSGDDDKQQGQEQGSEKDQPGQPDDQSQSGQDNQDGKADEHSSAGEADKKEQQAAPPDKAAEPDAKDGQKSAPGAAEQADEKPSVTPPELPPSDSGQEPLSQEQQQALQQWLRQIPDNPGGLLKRKFEYEYSTKQRQRNRRQEGKIW